MPPIKDHPLRYQLANELHARPFPSVSAPGHAAFLAIKPTMDASGRNMQADFDHLTALLDRYGAAHPQPGATHYSGHLGRHLLKWESHTEFVTYTIFEEGTSERPFDARTFSLFPDDWLAAAPGVRVTSALIWIEVAATDADIPAKVKDWFVPESLAISRVLDDALVIAGDFRIDHTGHTRLAIFARPKTGDQRIGRVVQRLCEIETYKSMSMLGLARAKELGPQLGAIDKTLLALQSEMRASSSQPEEVLEQLLAVSAELEDVVAQTGYRFGATGAYERIVNQRIDILREERFEGRQTFAEFMMRRFDPAMRTVSSTQERLSKMSRRAQRAADLLRTQVDVARAAQSQALLASMDRRADLQLRLQGTVEGLSVVAISYYAINLVLYALGPLAGAFDISKVGLAAVATPVVILCVWWMVRRIKRHHLTGKGS